MTDEDCVICHTPSKVFDERQGGDLYKVKCPSCGDFAITGTASRMLENAPILSSRQIANACGYVRQNQGMTISSEDVATLRSVEAPSVVERAEKLFIAIYKKWSSIGEQFAVPLLGEDSLYWKAITFSVNEGELLYLLRNYMRDTEGWINEHSPGNPYIGLITPRGHDHVSNVQRGNIDKVAGFCAMWFDSSMNPIWSHAIRPAIMAAGYDAIRIDGVEHNNKIDDEILANIRASRFVVADFTGERGGVYFEAGFAMGLGRPVIWTVQKDWLSKVHFDNRQYNFIVWNPNDLEDFKKRLHLRIEATIGRGPLELDPT